MSTTCQNADRASQSAVQHGLGRHWERTPVVGELFKLMAGVDLVHVPYRGSYWADLLSGQVQVQLLRSLRGHIQPGTLRALVEATIIDWRKRFVLRAIWSRHAMPCPQVIRNENMPSRWADELWSQYRGIDGCRPENAPTARSAETVRTQKGGCELPVSWYNLLIYGGIGALGGIRTPIPQNRSLMDHRTPRSRSPDRWLDLPTQPQRRTGETSVQRCPLSSRPVYWTSVGHIPACLDLTY